VVAREDVRGRFQRHPISLRQFENECALWYLVSLDGVVIAVDRDFKNEVFSSFDPTRLSPATSAAGSLFPSWKCSTRKTVK
jgi:hypothetical protein